MDQIGIGVIAAGQMGQRHANVYRQLPEVQLRAVADLNPQAARAAADPAAPMYTLTGAKFSRVTTFRR